MQEYDFREDTAMYTRIYLVIFPLRGVHSTHHFHERTTRTGEREDQDLV